MNYHTGENSLALDTCAELSPHATKLLFDVLAMLGPNGSGNGDISLTPKLMMARGWPGRQSLNAAVRELVEANLLCQTRQGSRLDCSLWALTLYPLDCDLSKLDVRPGCYLMTDWMKGATVTDKPNEAKPAKWKRARKTQTVAPPRDEVSKIVPPRDEVPTAKHPKTPTSSRHGTKPPFF